MSLLIYDRELSELLEDFYILTGMQIGIFDRDCNEVMSYPKDEKHFCAYMRKNKEFDALCRESDMEACKKCRKTKGLIKYKCHAGLTEAAAPIAENDRIIGYMIFGQVTESKSKSEFAAQMEEICQKYYPGEDMKNKIKKIKYRGNKQILAAAKILDALTEYVRLREIIRPSGEQLIDRMEDFVEEHISEEITIERLCREFGVSRTRLYEITAPYISGTIGEFIRRKRLSYAKKLLKNTDLSIDRVAEEVGFGDYNYFLRVFKKEYGISPKKYAASQRGEKS